MVNGKFLSTNYRFPMREWHKFCLSMELRRGSWSIYIDDIAADSSFADPVFMNSSSTLPGGGVLILGQDQDTLGGGFQETQSFCGDITDLNIWKLTEWKPELEANVTLHNRVKETILNWNDAVWKLSGDVKRKEVGLDDVTLTSGFPTYVSVAKKKSFREARHACIVLQGKLAAPTSALESEILFNISKIYFEQCLDIAYLYLWVGYTDAETEGVWRDATTGEVVPYEGSWSEYEPNGGREENCASLFHDSDVLATWGDFYCGEQYVLCFVCQFKNRVTLTLKGLCDQTDFDYDYTIAGTKNGTPYFAGRRSTEIYFDQGTQFWVMKLLENGDIFGYLQDKETLLPTGSHDWNFSTEECGSRTLTLTLTACGHDRYTCRDGSCVHISQRCNRRVECADKTDEDDCSVLEIPKGYQRETSPPAQTDEGRTICQHESTSTETANGTTDDFLRNEDQRSTRLPSSGCIQRRPLSVFLHVDIQAVPSIDTVDMLFTVDFQMTFQWSDSRLLFRNLKNRRDLNALSSQEKRDIWVPTISFGNAVGNQRSRIDDDIKAYAIKTGQSMQLKHKLEQIYNGSSVILTFSRKYDIAYVCDFDFHLYPFDSQTCLMGFTLLLTTKERVRLIPNGVTFLGKRQLIESTIGDISMFEGVSLNSSFSSVLVRIEFIRESGFHLLTTYLPTSLMIIIAYLTFYFRLQNFTDRIMVSLTSLLVLASLLTQTSETMPKTSYFKMVDVWLFSCIVTIFTVILFHTASVVVGDRVEELETSTEKKRRQKCKMFEVTPQKILNGGKLVLPVGLLIFNLIYWTSAYIG